MTKTPMLHCWCGEERTVCFDEAGLVHGVDGVERFDPPKPLLEVVSSCEVVSWLVQSMRATRERFDEWRKMQETFR